MMLRLIGTIIGLNMKEMEIAPFAGEPDIGPLKGVCCSQPGDKITGTYFFGGAGMNGSYISPMVTAFRQAGIKSSMFTDQDKWSAGITKDAAISTILWRDYDPDFKMLLRIPDRKSPQFNLIGYSYGSVISAQLAAKYARKGTVVDHLVLIGSPISKSFITTLNEIKPIKKVIIIDLVEYGDPIYAGINILGLFSKLTLLASQKAQAEGHFYYIDPTLIGDKRRKILAEDLYRQGLR